MCSCRACFALLAHVHRTPALVAPSPPLPPRYFSLCYDELYPDHGLTPDAKRASLLTEWEKDSQGLPAMTGLLFFSAAFELIGGCLAVPCPLFREAHTLRGTCARPALAFSAQLALRWGSSL